jgi:CheY-like chemotaxis protein
MQTVQKKILIVDDVQMFIELQKTLLNRRDFTLITARTGQEALVRAREEKPDLILLDLYMPDMNGDAVCKELKSKPDTGHIPILIITTDNAQEFRDLCTEAGCDGYLTKPIRKETFIPAIENHLGVPRRRHKRVKTRIPCTIVDADGSRGGVIHTLSPEGAFVEADPPPEAGDILKVEFTLDDNGMKLMLQAAVKWAREAGGNDPEGGGCEFIGLQNEDVVLLKNYLEPRSGDVED